MITADKVTINRRQCQTVLAILTIDGEKQVVPVGAPLVYDGSEGGSSIVLAHQMFEVLSNNWQLPEPHLEVIAGLFLSFMYE